MSNIIDPPHYLDSNNWEPLPDSEIDRLQKNLSNHLRVLGIKKSNKDRIQFVKDLLKKQHNTCALSNSDGKYCWNEPKENWKNGQQVVLPYLKFTWGHIVPRSRATNQDINDLSLMCARCNNQLQTSRNLVQLPAELLSKTIGVINLVGEDKTIENIIASMGKEAATDLSDRLMDLASRLNF